MGLFSRRTSSKSDKDLKNQAPLNREERLKQEALQKIADEKEQIFNDHKNLKDEREKTEGRAKINKQAKTERWYNRKHTDGSRARFGMHQISSSSGIYQIKEAIDINQKEIKNFIKTHELKNLPAEPKLKSVSLAFKDHEKKKELIAEYETLENTRKNLKKQEEKALEYEKLNIEWQHWKDSDDMPSASVKDRILDIIKKDALPKGLSKIPVIGPFIGMGLLTYKRLQLSISEVRDETRNILAGTRQKTAIGRIAGMISGSVVGGVGMGVTLALAGSFIPGVGTAVGGIAGVILGSTLGAAAGGPVGVKIFNLLSSGSKRLKNEQDYEMPYTQLKNLRTFYGLSENQVLKMNAYLSNQIKIEGSKSNNGKALSALKKSALEQGRQNALAKLCFYFITQEKIVRAELHNTGIAYLNNQQERALLLRQRRTLEKGQPSDADIVNYENSLVDYPFIKALYQIKKENNITKSYSELVTEFFESYPTKGSDEQKQAYLKNLQLTLNLDKDKANAFVKLMIKNGMNMRDGLNKFINEDTRHNAQPPHDKWINQLNKNDTQLELNEKAAQDISQRRFQLGRDRDGIIDILKEFKAPRELNSLGQTRIYGEMKKNPAFGKPIEALFEQDFDKSNDKGVWVPKDFRAFNDDYAVLNSKSNEINKAHFREDMRENAFKEAIHETERHTPSFWKLDFSEAVKSPSINLMINKNHVTSITNSLDDINKRTMEFINHLKNNSQSPEKTNNDCKKVIFDLMKLEQTFPELKDLITPKIRALQDIQFYLDYAAINHVYARDYLALPHDSPLHDLFPYTEKGYVTHLKEGDKLVENNIKNITQRMSPAEDVASDIQEQITNKIKKTEEINTSNKRIKKYNKSNPDKIDLIHNEISTLSHAEIQQLRSADASAQVSKKKPFKSIVSGFKQHREENLTKNNQTQQSHQHPTDNTSNKKNTNKNK